MSDVANCGPMTHVGHKCPSTSEAASIGSVWKKLTGRKLWYLLRGRSSRGRARLECYKDKKSADDAGQLRGCVPLTDVTGVRLHDSDSKKLVVEWPDIVHTFKCSSSADAQEWVEALTKLLADQLPRSRSRVWPEQDMSRPGIGQNEDTPRVEDKHASFTVTVNKHFPNLHFSGKCELVITLWDIQLKDPKTKRSVYVWPLHLIRQYGNGSDHFWLEAGRRCNTGEGIFRFKTTNNDGLAIYRVVHANSETRAKLNSSSALPRPPSPPALPTTIENVYDCIDESAMTPTNRKDSYCGSEYTDLLPVTAEPSSPKSMTYMTSQSAKSYDQVSLRDYTTLIMDETSKSASVDQQQYMQLEHA
ncbi:docking protein 4-like [Corticium candelabrum]|uniref:docking protein 4-like n=1 Tax=Corticium candelabrum TaxID=121492 RepID=UPI002E255A0E|nr:docking protein 4-like [Corticium candelabrum]